MRGGHPGIGIELIEHAGHLLVLVEVAGRAAEFDALRGHEPTTPAEMTPAQADRNAGLRKIRHNAEESSR